MKYFNKEIKKRYITDEPDNAIDIREVFPEVDSTITIIGDLKNIMIKCKRTESKRNER